MERKVKSCNKLLKSATINTYKLNQNMCKEGSIPNHFTCLSISLKNRLLIILKVDVFLSEEKCYRGMVQHQD